MAPIRGYVPGVGRAGLPAANAYDRGLPEVNSAFWPHLNVLCRNYLMGGIVQLRGYELEPVLALKDFPHESLLKVCAVVFENGTAIARWQWGGGG